MGALFSDQAEPETEIKTPELPVITNESEVISKKSEVKPPESPIITNESEVISKKSDVKPPESPIITNESEVISKKSDVTASAEKNKNQKQRPGSRAYKRKQRSPATKTKQKIEIVDQEILEQAINEGLESPRLSTWSPLVMSTLRYLQLTTGRFSMSREVSETLEAAFREKYPELFERIEKEIRER